MSRSCTRGLATFALASLLLVQAACSSSDPMADILKSFAGNWKVASLDRNGKQSDADALKDMNVTVAGDRFSFTEMSGAARKKDDVATRSAKSEEYVIQVNPAQKGEIDFVYAAGENEGKSRPGLYQLEGQTLKIGLAAPGNPRPTQIAPDRDITVFVLERQPN